MKYLFLSLVLISCASLSPEERSRISEISNTNGCKYLGDIEGSSGMSFEQAKVDAIKGALQVGANGYFVKGTQKTITMGYVVIAAYSCQNLAQNQGTPGQYQQQRVPSSNASGVYNALKTLHQQEVNQRERSNRALQQPKRTKCRTVKRNYMGQTQYESVCTDN